jgi:copper chaperone NosL
VKKLLVAIVALAASALLIVRWGTRLPDEVQPIAWNEAACGHCHMLIGDPAFAAQVITDDGEVVSFDDPGCAARYLREHEGHVHRAWFHEGRGERWLPVEEVGFVRVPASPMGTNVMAVPKSTPGALALEDLR